MATHQDTQNGADKAQAKALDDALKGEAAAIETMGQAAMKDGQDTLKEIAAGSNEWMSWAQKAYQANLKACRALMECRSFGAAATVQTDLIQEHVKLMIDNSHRVSTAMAKSLGGRPSHSK